MEVLILILSIIALLVYCWLPRYRYRKKFESFEHFFYAHRGYHNADFPENTLGAFARAVSCGYGIELDVQLTLDHQVVVCHDFNLVRATGLDLEIDEYVYEELKPFPLFGKDCHLPLFQEVLALVDGKVPLIVEIKQKGIDCSVCEHVQELLDQYSGDYVVESFNPLAMNWYLKHRPTLLRGQLSYDFKKDKKMKPWMQFLLSYCFGNCLSRPDFVAYGVHDRRNLAFQLLQKVFRVKTVLWTIKDETTYHEVKKEADIIIFEHFQPK